MSKGRGGSSTADLAYRLPSLATSESAAQEEGLAADHRSGDHRDPAPLDQVITAAMAHLLREQLPDGAWPHGFEMGVMPDAQTAIFLYLLGYSDVQWTQGLIQRILETQNMDGSWGPYEGAAGDVSTTVECYYALTLYDAWQSQSPLRLQAAAFIRAAGGLTACRNLTKVLLASGGELPWSELPSAAVYAWLWSRLSPIRMSDMVTFTRLHVASMVVLSADQFVSPQVTQPLLTEFAASATRPTRGGVRWPIPGFLLRRCHQYLHSERERDGTLAGYHSSTFLFLLAQMTNTSDAPSADTKAALRAVRRVWGCPFGEAQNHQQTCDAHVWNTALTLHTLRLAGLPMDHDCVQRAASYLWSRQHSTQWDAYRQTYQAGGGWGFSSNNTRHPDVDDTVACLEALTPASSPDDQRNWQRAVQWLLKRQNKDGGWSAFDQNCGKRWMERIPANDMRHAIADPSTPDVTGRVVALLVSTGVCKTKSPIIVRALCYLLREQEQDGSWYGRWGSTYLYGTWCATRAMCLCDRLVRNESATLSLTRACQWLLSCQNSDGSYGESCRSDELGRYEPLGIGVASQTAWALDSLLCLRKALLPIDTAQLQTAIDRAADWLIKTGLQGRWHDPVPTGSAFPGALHIRYHLYPKLWPLYALTRYRQAHVDGITQQG